MQKYRARHVNTSICLASLEPKYTHADIPKMTLFLKKRQMSLKTQTPQTQ